MRLKPGKDTVLVIPDCQAPYHHQDAIAFLGALKRKWKPTKVVNIGDSVDQHQLGRFVPDPDAPGAGDEHKEALKFLKSLYQLFPNGVEVESNHNFRYAKRAADARLSRAYLRPYEEIMGFPPGWSLAPWFEIDDVVFEHGERASGGQINRNIAMINQQSTVYGHHHSAAGIAYLANRKNLIWAMNVGCLIDHESYGLAYAKTSKFFQTLGAGIVQRGVPYFEPMIIDSKNRWVGNI